MKTFAALIPAYCPGPGLPALVRELTRNEIKCIVINDGSPAEYNAIFEEAAENCTLLTHETNRGKGAALKTGMAYIESHLASDQTDAYPEQTDSGQAAACSRTDCRQAPAYSRTDCGQAPAYSRTDCGQAPAYSRTDCGQAPAYSRTDCGQAPACSHHSHGSVIVVTADADGQHLPEDVLRCAQAASESPSCLVLGTRSFQKEDVPFRSYYGNKITETVFSAASGAHISDTQTGLRAFSADLIPSFLTIEGDRYEYELSQLLFCVKAGIGIQEVPISTVYQDNNACSHFHPVRDSFLIYRQLLTFAAAGLLSSRKRSPYTNAVAGRFNQGHTAAGSGFLPLSQLLAFAGSGFFSFLLDFSLFAIFSDITGHILAANVGARIISAACNYTMNRRLVFQDRGHPLTSLLRYAALACSILVLNTSILYLLTACLGLHGMIAKALTEVLLFFCSFMAQRRFVFSELGAVGEAEMQLP